MSATPHYIDIRQASHRLGVPEAWLRREADARRVPHLLVGRRRMFDIEAVGAALRERAEPEPQAVPA